MLCCILMGICSMFFCCLLVIGVYFIWCLVSLIILWILSMFYWGYVNNWVIVWGCFCLNFVILLRVFL